MYVGCVNSAALGSHSERLAQVRCSTGLIIAPLNLNRTKLSSATGICIGDSTLNCDARIQPARYPSTLCIL